MNNIKTFIENVANHTFPHLKRRLQANTGAVSVRTATGRLRAAVRTALQLQYAARSIDLGTDQGPARGRLVDVWTVRILLFWDPKYFLHCVIYVSHPTHTTYDRIHTFKDMASLRSSPTWFHPHLPMRYWAEPSVNSGPETATSSLAREAHDAAFPRNSTPLT